jgi:hypothetical protein
MEKKFLEFGTNQSYDGSWFGRLPSHTLHLLLVAIPCSETQRLGIQYRYAEPGSCLSNNYKRDHSLRVTDVCGFFFRDPPEYSPPSELEEFLKDGPAPIYIGFGSIVMDNPENMTRTILESVHETGVRAIVSKGWSKLGTGVQDPNVFFLDDCPHGRLAPTSARAVTDGPNRMALQTRSGGNSPRWSRNNSLRSPQRPSHGHRSLLWRVSCLHISVLLPML